MLAKQDWRLKTNIDSLVTSLIKARYYPNTDFLNADLGANPSFFWRINLEAQNIVRQGARRRIGDGCSTKIWMEPCLPCCENGYLTTEVYRELEHITANSLMDEGQKKWSEEFLCDLFNERYMQLIKRIPIPTHSKEDSVVLAARRQRNVYCS